MTSDQLPVVSRETDPDARSGALRKTIAFRFPAPYRVAWIALVLIVVFSAATERDILSTPSARIIATLAGVLLIASLGQLLVVMVGGFDLSIPATMTLASAVMVKVTDGSNGSLAGACVLAVALGAGIGLANGVLVAYLRLNALIVTLAVNGIVTSGLTLWAGTSFSVSGTVPPALESFAKTDVGPVSLIAVAAVACAAAVAGFLSRTRPGKRLIAAGTNPVAARMLGVHVERTVTLTFVTCGAAAALAGIGLSGIVATPDLTIGQPYLLTTVLAVAIGGAALDGGPASVAGVGVGCVFITMLDQFLIAKGYSQGVTALANGVALGVVAAGITAGSWIAALVRRRPRRPSTASPAVPN
jgi:ribose transport system permease protein